VRGYLQSEALGDDGLFASVELRSPSFASFANSKIDQPIFDDWRGFLFADGAYSWVLQALPSVVANQPGQQSVFRISSVGLGTRIHALSHLSSDLDLAFPLQDATVTKAWQPYFQFTVKSEL
jgi:hemolysin activation/secretion protein